MSGTLLWNRTHPALPTPPALQDPGVVIEKDLVEGDQVEEEEVVAVVVVAVEEEEEEECQLSQPTAICRPSWAT